MSSSAQSAAETEIVQLPMSGPVPVPPAKDPTEVFPWLKCQITLELPIVHFTIRDLLELKPGTVLETECKATSDVPVQVNGSLIGWTEFEVIGNTLAVRITELA